MMVVAGVAGGCQFACSMQLLLNFLILYVVCLKSNMLDIKISFVFLAKMDIIQESPSAQKVFSVSCECCFVTCILSMKIIIPKRACKTTWTLMWKLHWNQSSLENAVRSQHFKQRPVIAAWGKMKWRLLWFLFFFFSQQTAVSTFGWGLVDARHAVLTAWGFSKHWHLCSNAQQSEALKLILLRKSMLAIKQEAKA